MIRIEVTPEVLTKEGVARATGKPFSIREQVAYAHLVGADGKAGKYPARILLPVRRDTNPLEPGEYMTHPSGFYVGDFGMLAFNPSHLVAVRPAQAVQTQQRAA